MNFVPFRFTLEMLFFFLFFDKCWFFVSILVQDFMLEAEIFTYLMILLLIPLIFFFFSGFWDMGLLD